ncbi:MAG: hypothetical protein PVG27_00230 [Chloroflexota bacterium]|jgi:hypothetical protein
MVTPELARRRRGSRREGTATTRAVGPGNPQGLVERVLSFEAYTGFPHQELGILVGLLHAVNLWVRGVGRRTHGRPGPS